MLRTTTPLMRRVVHPYQHLNSIVALLTNQAETPAYPATLKRFDTPLALVYNRKESGQPN